MISQARFLIVEDELLIAETISDFLKQGGAQSITIVDSVDEAIEHLDKHKADLVLTDIVLGRDKTGIDLGNALSSKYKIPFIYITSHADKSIVEKAKHSRPNAYIVKPFKKDDIMVAIELALYSTTQTPSDAEPDEIIVKEGRSVVKIQCPSILWMESDRNYSTIYLNDGSRKIVRQSLSELQDLLPAQQFIRIHKSCIVNKHHITQVNSHSVMIHKAELPVGRAYQHILNDIFQQKS
ncbi:MAG: response regulator [Bacteroidetes bacterium]|nr:response regulator [Bacteroidota bacterium]